MIQPPDRPVTLTLREIVDLKQKLADMQRDVHETLSTMITALEQVLPDRPVKLTPEEIAELNQQLKVMRHDINNNLALVIGGAELVRLRPESIGRMIELLLEQPGRITKSMLQFSGEFEKALHIRR